MQKERKTIEVDFDDWQDKRRYMLKVNHENECLKVQLEKKEKQVTGLVEALQEIGINGFSNMDRDKARAALAAYKE